VTQTEIFRRINVMNQLPSLGRIIRVVLKTDGGVVVRPAIIVRTWGDAAKPQTYVNAQVFTDESNDGLPGTLWKTSLTFDPSATLENSWHWPSLA